MNLLACLLAILLTRKGREDKAGKLAREGEIKGTVKKMGQRLRGLSPALPGGSQDTGSRNPEHIFLTILV